MFAVLITEKGGAQRKLPFDKKEVTIGRIQGNDVVLPKGNVSKRHSRIVLQDNRFIVVDLKSTNGTYVNGRKINSPLVVKPGDKIYIGDFILTLEGDPSSVSADAGRPETARPPAAPAEAESEAGASPAEEQSESPPDDAAAELGGPTAPPPPNEELVRPTSSAPPPKPDEGAPSVVGEASIAEPSVADEAPASRSLPKPPPAPPMRPSGSFSRPPSPAQLRPRATRPSTMPPGAGPVVRHPSNPPPAMARAQSVPPGADDIEPQTSGTGFGPKPVRVAGPARVVSGDLASCVHEVLSRLSARVHLMSLTPVAVRKKRPEIQKFIGEIVTELAREQALGELDPRRVVACTADEAMGFGPIDLLLGDASVREIVIEAPESVMVDRGQGATLHATPLSSRFGAELVARRLRTTIAGEVDDDSLVTRGKLPSGEQVTVIMPPVAIHGPYIEVRRRRNADDLKALVEAQMLDQPMADLLAKAVAARCNIAVVGAEGTGVTRLLGALVTETAEAERVLTVEQVPDLRFEREHVVALGFGSAGSGLTLPAVLADAILLHADRLVVDDVPASDLYAVLGSLATRGDGSMVGVHARGDGSDALNALRVLARASSPVDRPVDELIALGLRLVVRLAVVRGKACIVGISEITAIDEGVAQVQHLFEYDRGFRATDKKPTF